MDKVSFEGVFEFINEHWEFNPNNYDQSMGETIDQKVNFGVRHIHLHLSKIAANIVVANGEIAKVVEDAEHSGIFLGNKLRQTPKQLVINAIKLADTLGVTPEELIRQLMDWAAEQYRQIDNQTTNKE